ncbi:porin [Alishewanella longhuensis]|uniref:Porin n=1 Tax=Alishewanella longhuensis TaxID=1091037 RepID=A0ABQ3L054_9ALTE|nr:porin [Alishewanella longhuensis]GHG68978.1 porin [Alishewanella longhuensis]
MKLSYAAACVLFVISPVSYAKAADIAFYGQIHVSLDQLDNDANNAFNVSSNSSRIGVKATHEVQQGLNVIGQIEALVRIEEGDTNSDYFDARDTFVGLQGSFGTARVGFFDTPMKKVRSRTDFFGDKVGDARNIVAGGGVNLDKRFRNGIHYQSPVLNNLTFDLHYSSNDATGSTTENENDAVSSSVTYQASGLTVMLAYERQNQLDDAQGQAVAARSGMRLGTRYKLNEQWQLAAFYQQSSNFNGGDRDAWGLGVGYKFGQYNLAAQYYQAGKADNAQSNATMLALGIDRSFSQSFNCYLAFAVTDNAEQANFNVSAGGHGKRLSISPGADPMAISFGTIYKF